ncbi:succinylglutamate desuccinylase/aspartoacylase [Halorubrum californiense DSM 19288]|uniref:Succinylglutamate desuccinylase/aspartoacylase n=1 Tax=Halorubrum californiense DSM 19288 TaxID=1227465 RepID=M0EFL6_9EURY|nr:MULTISPECIES: succinylglutamate desuccinylase/aspartoacylase family protein [Halorubrum]ELZ45687.1 succinylglutamate desuccinylase/aspartoacylase [Halorubrum californiense DSM 19288]TKX72267.1 succinylglutamate desuccinylase [Halorubrum sp. GN11GM_10-3_MGM]
MQTIDRESAGSARVAIVGGIHGDEPAGVRIVERLAAELPPLDSPDGGGRGDAEPGGLVRLILANEPAIEAETRYTDADLNRAFPGDADSDEYERALAPRLAAELQGFDAVLALHTSHSAPPPFAIFSDLTASVRRTVTGLPVDHVVDASGLRSTTLDSTIPHTVSIEVGRQGSEEAVEFGYEACLAFLRVHGALADEPPTFSETVVVKGNEEVPKGSGEPHVHFANFEAIPEGAVFAEDDVYTHRVEEPGVVPILASEHGYDEIFGMYGRVTGVLKPPDEGDLRVYPRDEDEEGNERDEGEERDGGDGRRGSGADGGD